jgi:hypothetical protein
MPQAPLTVKRFANGRYLMLFYCSADEDASLAPLEQEPVLAGERAVGGGEVRFSQPEIVFFEYACFSAGTFCRGGQLPRLY